MGHPVVMGRKTFENDVKKPLKGRPNIVLTRNSAYVAPDGEGMLEPGRGKGDL